MSKEVFLDSGIFVAFLSERDKWHQPAVSLFAQPKVKWHTSILVISETYSWFLHKMGEEAAREYRGFLANLSGLTVHEAGLAHHRDTQKMLDRLRGSKLTYVDASSLCVLDKQRIKEVWATDYHLSLNGAVVYPQV